MTSTSKWAVAGPTVEYASCPLGLDVARPRFTWPLVAQEPGRVQTAYQVRVATDADRLSSADVWDSGRVRSSESVLVPYDGPALAPRTRYHWSVRAWDNEGQASEWSAPTWWETGLMEQSQWSASWIAAPESLGTCAQLRRGFSVADKQITQARLYITALGLYEVHLNGRRVGGDRLAPGWTDYRRRVQYQSHDVTDLIGGGANAIGVQLAEGWYAGTVAWYGTQNYGKRPALLAQLEVGYADGTTQRYVSDASWTAARGPIVAADLLHGESYDARLATPGWTGSGFDDSGWSPVDVLDTADTADTRPSAQVVAQVDAPIRAVEELAARTVTEPEPGIFVLDLGQNMVGSIRLHVEGPAGTTITLRYAEVLNPDGTCYTANLRKARATDTYTLKGDGLETYEPRFTFHGFRYVEISGYPGAVPASAVTGVVLQTDAPFSLDFATDVPMLNQLHSNIRWGQRGNFLSIPTDTPARDERLGWTGDINVFAPTACSIMESARFLTKWLTDLRDSQSPEGIFPDTAPHLGPVGDAPVGDGVAGWGDAGVTVPWALYQAYGDRRILAESWSSIVRWIDHLRASSQELIRSAAVYGDWLNIDDETPKDVIATAYFAHSADLTARIAEVLGEDGDPFRELFEDVRNAFRTAYVTEGGRIRGDTQTAYVLALSMDLLAEADRGPAADRLVDLIEARDWHLSTGFLGTPRLLPVLTATGRTDVAYRLLHQRTFPSWGYPIERGATTMWERWDSIKPDGSFQSEEMNSFNHYAYGSVGEWMYTNIAGIAATTPGFRTLRIRPRPGGEVHEARARFISPYGPVATHWTDRDGRFKLEVTLAPNTSAEIWLPVKTAAGTGYEGAEYLRQEDGCLVFGAGSGTSRFSCPRDQENSSSARL
ncbi:alpha-L-rhamnosidase [Catenulispora pinisilvae]|uniref:alpha-L-rhamnosidase n=1 Tax=Catenulispora pinisilvae TaxID=2705253 RepID=UPI0018915088|nr:alpha-L-rhamnosidase [Catenulispora pinisilvae]